MNLSTQIILLEAILGYLNARKDCETTGSILNETVKEMNNGYDILRDITEILETDITDVEEEKHNDAKSDKEQVEFRTLVDKPSVLM